MDYAKSHGLYEEYKPEVDFLYLKKGCLSSIFNHINNSTEPQKKVIAEILSELNKTVPDWSSNKYYKSKYKLRLLTFMLFNTPTLAIKIIQQYLKTHNMAV